jgi:hypothetical protein
LSVELKRETATTASENRGTQYQADALDIPNPPTFAVRPTLTKIFRFQDPLAEVGPNDLDIRTAF